VPDNSSSGNMSIKDSQNGSLKAVLCPGIPKLYPYISYKEYYILLMASIAIE